MITTKSSDLQNQQLEQANLNSALFWTKNLLILFVGSIVLTTVVTFLAVIYWCSKQQKISKNQSQLSELTSFSPNSIQIQTTRPKEIKLFPILPKLVQPISPNHDKSLTTQYFSSNTTDTCSTAESSSSSATFAGVATKKFRKKNLLER